MVTYKQSGVNIDTGNELVKRIRKIVPEIGFFSGFYPVYKEKLNQPVLVSSSDGVGTKLKLAFLLNKHNSVGIDLVAMNVNDIITCGAKPLFFLDYYACGKLDLTIAEKVIQGIACGCEEAECALLGGETAEMPGFYQSGEYDLGGFAVGIIEKNRIIDGKKVKPGNLIIGLPSSGLHSNGYSLVRKVFSEKELLKWGKTLLEPTIIYVKRIKKLLSIPRIVSNVYGIAHITGGGFIDNIPRVLPKNCQAVIDKSSWTIPDIFHILQERGKITEPEIFRTLNMGIGMILVVNKSVADKIARITNGKIIGEIVKGETKVRLV